MRICIRVHGPAVQLLAISPHFFFLEKQSVCLVFINHPCPKMGAQSYR